MSTDSNRRVLRHAPKPHVPFVPETHNPRPRHHNNQSSSRHSTPTAAVAPPSVYPPSFFEGGVFGTTGNGHGNGNVNGNGNGNGFSTINGMGGFNGGSINGGFDQQQYIVAKPINENNQFDNFQQQQQAALYNRQQSKGLLPFNYTGIPGVGVPSVDLQTRLKFALLSGLEEEVRWALTQLVSMSKNIPHLLNLKNNVFYAEQLIEHYRQCPFIDPAVKYKATYPYLLQNLGKDGLGIKIENSVDAALALRNLSQDTDSAQILSLNPVVKETAIKILQSDIITNELPVGETYDSASSLLQFTVDIVESISSYIAPAYKDDELFITLVTSLTRSTDRSIIISILRSLSRLLVRSNINTKTQYASENITSHVLDTVINFLLIETDPELILTALDFLYQYILPGGIRITNLLKSTTRQLTLMDVLPRLLTHGLTIPPQTIGLEPLRLIRRARVPAPEVAKRLSDQLYEEVNKLDEPLRATVWMRCCFKAIQESDVTQISLWKSYELQFQKEHGRQGGKKLLPAVDFIKNVSNAFPNSAAMVITNPETNQRKFIIKGIEPRHVPADIQTGNLEAANPALAAANSTDGTSPLALADKSLPSQQIPVNIMAAMVNKPKKITDIGNSTSLLLTGLVVHDKGKMLVKAIESDLIKKVDEAPILYENLVDCLTAVAGIQS